MIPKLELDQDPNLMTFLGLAMGPKIETLLVLEPAPKPMTILLYGFGLVRSNLDLIHCHPLLEFESSSMWLHP